MDPELSEKQLAFLTKCEEEFKDRFKAGDNDYENELKELETSSEPPVYTPWRYKGRWRGGGGGGDDRDRDRPRHDYQDRDRRREGWRDDHRRDNYRENRKRPYDNQDRDRHYDKRRRHWDSRDGDTSRQESSGSYYSHRS